MDFSTRNRLYTDFFSYLREYADYHAIHGISVYFSFRRCVPKKLYERLMRDPFFCSCAPLSDSRSMWHVDLDVLPEFLYNIQISLTETISIHERASEVQKVLDADRCDRRGTERVFPQRMRRPNKS